MSGGTFFFTVVTHERRKFLCEEENVLLLRAAFREVMKKHPFTIDAAAILPDHIHGIWTLPPDDKDFSNRWRLIKNYFSRRCNPIYKGIVSASRQEKGEQAVWQRRFWEHQIKDENDFNNHVNYIHYNPVKHGYVTAPLFWEYSSFHVYVKNEVLDSDWGAGVEMKFPDDVGFE